MQIVSSYRLAAETTVYIFSIRYPTPICVWIYREKDGTFSIFLRNVAMNTRREATSLSHALPQTSLSVLAFVIVRRYYLRSNYDFIRDYIKMAPAEKRYAKNQ